MTGDGLLTEFSSVVDAVRCAVAFQEGMAERNVDTTQDRRIEFRIGINLGDVIIEGEDIYGDGVNLAARLEALADPGGICVSASVYDQVRHKIDLSYEDLGRRTVKNITEPIHVYRVRLGRPEGVGTGMVAAVVTQPPPKPTIACLPFRNLGDDVSQKYFADGLRLAIQASLVQMPALLLIAPPAVNRYRDQDVAVEQVAQDLDVRYVLEGAAQQAGTRIRITAQLTDTIEGHVVWADRYDREFAETLATQDEISAKIVTALGIKLVGGDGFWMARTLKKLDVIDFFYRGLTHFYAYSRIDNAAARRCFEDVERLQPDSPIGAAFVSATHWFDVSMGWSESRNRSLKQAVDWAEKAVKFEVTNGLAHIVLACIHLLNRRYDEALATCRTAVELRPSCPIANFNLANVLHYCGLSAEAFAFIIEAVRILPVSPPWFLVLLVGAYREIGDVEQSITTAKKVVEQAPNGLDARLSLCSSYGAAGYLSEAKKAAQSVIALDPEFSISGYVENQSFRYKEAAAERRLIESLRAAGLPE